MLLPKLDLLRSCYHLSCEPAIEIVLFKKIDVHAIEAVGVSLISWCIKTIPKFLNHVPVLNDLLSTDS